MDPRVTQHDANLACVRPYALGASPMDRRPYIEPLQHSMCPSRQDLMRHDPGTTYVPNKIISVWR